MGGERSLNYVTHIRVEGGKTKLYGVLCRWGEGSRSMSRRYVMVNYYLKHNERKVLQ